LSKNNCILKTLNLEEENLILDENFCEDYIVSDVKGLLYKGVLLGNRDKCLCCGDTDPENRNIHGYKKSIIKLVSVSGFDAYLELKKQRLICKKCKKTYITPTDIVDKHCFISKNVKKHIALELKEKTSQKDIAKRNNVSSNTVARVLESFRESHKVDFNYLPEVLCFDEFKSTKDADGAMSFIYMDGKTHKIIDIVQSRRLNYLITYFNRYTNAAKNQVKYIVIDMYAPYISLIKKCFPHAKIIIDRFHIYNLISRSLNKTRIKLMKKDKHNYNKLKVYYKLLLKDMNKLNCIKYIYQRCFKSRKSELEIVNYLLDLSEELRETYFLYQEIASALRNNDIDRLSYLINENYDDISEYMQTSVNTLREYEEYILNAARYPYSNGPLEGLNNKIKVLKRVSFGFRSFENLKIRVLLAS